MCTACATLIGLRRRPRRRAWLLLPRFSCLLGVAFAPAALNILRLGNAAHAARVDVGHALPDVLHSGALDPAGETMSSSPRVDDDVIAPVSAREHVSCVRQGGGKFLAAAGALP